MHLTYLCDAEMAFESAPILVRPYGGEEGTSFGQGGGTFSGESLRGAVRWVNLPHRRSDGNMLPDIRGVLTTEDGATITFSMQGRTVFTNGPQGLTGSQILQVLFEAQEERYRWLNGAVCVSEARVDMQAGRPVIVGPVRIYTCENDLLK